MIFKKMSEKDILRLQPREKRYKITLAENFYIEIKPNGQKIYRVKKGDKTKTLGSSKELTYIAAQALVEKAIAALIDPRLGEQKYSDVFDKWLAHKDWAYATYKKRESIINNYLQVFKRRDIKTIQRLEILTIIQGIEAQGKIETAVKALNIIKQVFDYALVCGYIETNPAIGLNSVLKRRAAVPRPAVVDEKNVRKLVNAISNHKNSTVKALFQFTMYTLCRPSECRLATWSEINGEIWTIPPERMKMRKAHVVPLPEQCMDILAEMEKIRINDYIFPSLFSKSKPYEALSDGTLRLALRKMGFDKDTMSIHGFRSMGSTILNEKGYRHDVIEKALAHAGEDKIRAIYNRAEYLNERRQMLQDYADYLESLLITNKKEGNSYATR